MVLLDQTIQNALPPGHMTDRDGEHREQQVSQFSVPVFITIIW